MASRGYGQHSGVAAALERVGERWALLIVRDLLVGARRYTDLKASLPRIPTNILSTRLKELQDAGVVRRVPLMNCGLVYELTSYGRELEPVVLALERWGAASLGEIGDDETVSADGLTVALRAAFAERAASAEGRWSAAPADLDVELRVREVVLRIQLNGGWLRIVRLAPLAPTAGGALPDGEAPLAVESPTGIRGLSGDRLRVIRGDDARLEAFLAAFGGPPIDPARGREQGIPGNQQITSR
jgi:DNA-binding HxlR family transcriptional regulator